MSELKNHASTGPFLHKIHDEKEIVQSEQAKFSRMMRRISQLSGYGSSYTEQLIEQKKHEAEVEKKRLNRLIADIECGLEEEIAKLRYNAVFLKTSMMR